MSDAGKHYRYEYKGIKLDPYRIMQVYKIENPAHQHAVKKLLRAGRSVKTLRQDIDETIMTLQRWLEMLGEDQAEMVSWPESEERMDVIGQNGPDGAAYGHVQP